MGVKMSYRVRFPNDYTHMEIPNIDGFTMDKVFDDVVFGWLDNLYVSVHKQDYEKYMENNNEV